MNDRKLIKRPKLIAALIFSSLTPSAVSAAQVFVTDLVVQGSTCTGFDCVNGESFGFDTLRLKENNLRIHFQDTSVSASFPTTDWRLLANDTGNGGGNFFAIEDADAGRQIFKVEASAPANSLFVDDGGRVGLGTSTPVVELHVVNGDSPTLRLEQNGSSGFTPQTWDIASNETNFFVRDATNGSRLPFKIRPSAPTNSFFIDTDGDIGFGTASPLGTLHIENTGGDDVDDFVVTADGKVGIGVAVPLDDLHISDAGAARFRLSNTTRTVDSENEQDWTINSNGTLRISAGVDASEFTLQADGDLIILGSLTTAGGITPDYVFQPDYKLMPLDELSKHISQKHHLPNIPSAAEIKEKGSLNMSEMQMKLLEKIEELTLYTLDQQQTIKSLQVRLAKLEN